MKQSEARRRRVALAALGAAAIGLAGAGTVASYTDQDIVTDNTFESGYLDLEVGPNKTAVSASGMAPGSEASGTIEVANAGTVPLVYDLSVAQTPDSGTLGQVLDLTMSGPDDDIVLDHSGFPSLSTTALASQSRQLDPGESEVLQSSIFMQRSAGREYMGDSATLEFTFDAVQGTVSEALETPFQTMILPSEGSAILEWDRAPESAAPQYRYSVDEGAWITSTAGPGNTSVGIEGADSITAQVRYRDGDEYGPWSQPVTMTAGDGPRMSEAVVDGNTLTVSWPHEVEVEYEYSVMLDDDGWSQPAIAEGGSASVDIRGVPSVRFRIREVGGEWSGTGHLVRDLALEPPSQVQSVTTQPAGAGEVLVEWEVGDGGGRPDQYDVVATQLPKVGSHQVSRSVPGDTTSVVVSGLSELSPYSFEVTGVNSVGVAVPSSPVTETPLPGGVRFTEEGTHTWTVPEGIHEITVHARGGSGQPTRNQGEFGAAGASVVGKMSVLPGESYDVVVSHVGGRGGYGGNAVLGRVPERYGGDGGGAADIRPAGGGVDERLIVAGGGGGNGGASSDKVSRGAGGAGGPAGGRGEDGGAPRFGTGGQGAGQDSGTESGLGEDGTGGLNSTSRVGGGGGGSGWRGGGGGRDSDSGGFGGGGGSSYIHPDIELVSTQGGVHFGTALLVITYGDN